MSVRPDAARSAVRPGTLPQAAPSTSRFVQTADVKLHYLDYGGEGRPTMLCVHGGAAHAHWFDFVASGFTSEFHVLALDLRGHGDSGWVDPPAYAYGDYAADVNRFAEALDLRDFVLVGHSMGGIVAIVYAATCPERLSKLVVVDSRMHMSEESVARLRDFGSRPASTYASRDELIARYRLEPAGTMVASPGIIRYIAGHSGRALPDGTWRHKFDRSLYSIFERLDAMPYWDGIRMPALLVAGDQSDRLDRRTFEQIAARSAHVSLVTVPDSNHHITLDNPSGFVDALTPFLKAP